MELIAPKSGRAWRLAAGSLLKVIDVAGGQTGDLFAVAADDPNDGQSNGRTFDYGDTIRLSTGSVLYSGRSRPLLTIIDDPVGTHDFLYAPCSQQMYEIGYGVTAPHPNCLDNLITALAEHGVPATTVTIAFNVFMNVVIGQDGSLDIQAPLSKPGDSLTFRAERDVLVAVTACPAATTNGGDGARPLGVEVS
jgi:uncharacterized protein